MRQRDPGNEVAYLYKKNFVSSTKDGGGEGARKGESGGLIISVQKLSPVFFLRFYVQWFFYPLLPLEIHDNIIPTRRL